MILKYFSESIEVDNTVKTIETWGPQYEIDFEVKFTGSFAPNVLYNLFRFTDNPEASCLPGSACTYGDVIPSVDFKYSSEAQKPIIQVAFAQVEGQNHTIYEDELELDMWYRVQIRTETSSNGEGLLNITINEVPVIQKVVSGKPFSDVTWYLSDPFSKSVKELSKIFQLKNFRVVNNVPEEFTHMGETSRFLDTWICRVFPNLWFCPKPEELIVDITDIFKGNFLKIGFSVIVEFPFHFFSQH